MEVKSIADIAALAGVAKTTVSAVLNGKAKQYRISESTCQRIRQLVKEHNYRPNRVARSLRTQKTNTIGLIVPDLRNCFFSELTTYFEAVAREAGYQVLIANSEDNKESELRAIENLSDFSVDGMIIASMFDDKELKKLIKTDVPTVFIDREIPGNNYFSVTSDHYSGAREVISCIAKESDEIAYIGRKLEISSAIDRFQAYKDVLAEEKIKLNEQLIFYTKDTIENGSAGLREIKKRLGRLPKAFFTSSYVLLLGAIDYLHKTYGSIPEDMPIATFDNSIELDLFNIKVHSVQQDCEEIARASFAALLSYLEGSPQKETVIVKTKVIKR